MAAAYDAPTAQRLGLVDVVVPRATFDDVWRNDQEILLRHLHTTAWQYVSVYQQRRPAVPVRILGAS